MSRFLCEFLVPIRQSSNTAMVSALATIHSERKKLAAFLLDE
jgi:hypothetical protein